MTTLVLGTVGGLIGNALLPGIGGSVGFLVGSLLGNLIDPPKVEGPRRSDLKLQVSEYGRNLPFVWGTGRIAGVVIDQTDLEEHSESSGGKGGPEVTSYTYSASFVTALAVAKRYDEAAIAGVSRIWADGKLIWTMDSGDTMPCTLYLGTESQEPDPTFEAIHGIGQQPAYRGVAYAVFADFYLKDYGDRIPQLEFEVYTSGGDIPWRVSTFDPWPDAAQTNIGARMVDGIITTSYYTSVAAHYYERQFTVDGTEVAPAVDDTIAFASTGEGFRQTVVGNLAGVAVFNSHNHGSFYGFFEDAETSMEISGAVPTAVLSIYQNGYIYSVGLIATILHIIRYAAPDGDPGESTPSASFDLSPYSIGAASGVRFGTSNDGHIWIVHTTTEQILKLDEDLNLVHAWDSATWHANFADLAYNFHVYNDMICFDNGKPSRQAWVMQVNDDWTFTYVGGVDIVAGPCITLQNGLVLVNDGVISLDPPAGPELLSTIVADLSSMTSLRGIGSPESDAYDVSELTDEVRWFAVGNQMTVRNALDPLRKAFAFDAVESDDLVKFRKRGATDSVVTLDDDDLCAREFGTEDKAPLLTVRKKEQGMPRTVTLRYIDVDMDYQTGAQASPRLTTLSDSDVTLDLAVGFTADEALQKCWALQVAEWIERESFAWSTTREYAWVEPCDVVTVRGRVVRITGKVETPSGVINWEGVLHRPSIYTQAQSAGSSSGFTEQTGTTEPVLTEAVLLDIPVLTQEASPFGFYAAMGPASDGRWPGATLYKSLDGGTTYAAVASSNVPSIIGETASSDDLTGSPTFGSPTVSGTLSAYSGGDVVEEASIIITLHDDDAELESVNATAFANGANLCAISRGTGGSPATTQWELLCFRDATLIDERTYLLSGFLRGRKGTATSGHGDGDTFVFLPVTNVDAPQEDLNKELYYKAVTFGKTLASATAFTFINTGVGAEEFFETEAGELPVITNPQTGTTYTLQSSDNFKLITFDNASPVTVTLPTTLKAGWHCFIENIGAGTVTLDAGATTIDEYVSTLDLETDQGVLLVWDGDEWYTMRGVGGATSGGGGSPSGTVELTAEFVLAAADSNVPNGWVATDAGNITFNTSGVGSPSGLAWWDLTTTGVTPGSYGDSYNSASLTVDAYGRITAAANAGIVQSIITEYEYTPIDVDAIALNFQGDVNVYDDGYGITNIDVPYRAPIDAPYVLAESIGSPNLTNARVLEAGTNITLTDGGAGGVITIDCTVSAGGGTGQSVEYTTPGTYDFSVPEGVSIVQVTMVGGGGGGSSRNAAAQGGGGGGAGESCISFPIPVDASSGSPSNTVTVIVGAAGTGAVGTTSTVAGGGGGDSYFGDFKVAGGRGSPATGVGGAGGGGGSGSGGAVGNPGGGGSLGTAESACHFGGSGGAGGGSATSANGGAGRPAPGYSTGTAGGTTAASQAGGGSGAGSLFGQGGQGGNGGADGAAPAAGAYGAGGGGAGGKATSGMNGGDGAGGYVLVTWVA
ncbi:MAG: phage tail protein [Candidatus Hydrogenedentes bacterium]|nr:phage tail protein [Candidatus Hydrogenedentota bacterium]